MFTTLFEADADGPAGQYTIGVTRTDTGGTVRGFRYVGCVPTGFEISVEENGHLTLSVDYDAQLEETFSPAGTFPVYPGSNAIAPQMFTFEDCALKVGPMGGALAAVTNFKSFSVAGVLGMDTERYFVQGDELKKRPIRSAVPEFTGQLAGEFADLVEYNRFVAGDPLHIQLVAIGSKPISSSINTFPSFQVDILAAQYDGSTPAASQDALSMIDVPFTALADNSDDVFRIQTAGGITPYL